MMTSCPPGSSSARLSASVTLGLFDKEVVPMTSTSPLCLIYTSTEPRRRRVREVEQPVINTTLQTDERRVFSVAEAAAILGISRSRLCEFIASGEMRTIHIGRLCTGLSRAVAQDPIPSPLA